MPELYGFCCLIQQQALVGCSIFYLSFTESLLLVSGPHLLWKWLHYPCAQTVQQEILRILWLLGMLEQELVCALCCFPLLHGSS